MNSEEQFEVRHYLSKTLQLFTKSTGSASEWFFSTVYLSLVGLFPTVGHTKKTVIPTLGLFIERKNAVSFKNLCKKYREPDLHCINKKPEYPHLKRKQTTGVIVSCGQKYFVYTHIHTQENNEKFVLFAHLHYTPSPRARSSGLFPQAASGTDGSR